MSPEDQVFFDTVTSREGDHGERRAVQRREYYRTLLHSPGFAAGLVDLGHAIVGMPSSRRNLALITVAADASSYFMLIGHIAESIATGITPEAIKAIIDGDEAPLTAQERLLSRFARQIVHLEVTDETFAHVSAELGPRPTVDFIATVNLLRVGIQFTSAFGVAEPTRAELDAALAEATEAAARGTPGSSTSHEN